MNLAALVAGAFQAVPDGMKARVTFTKTSPGSFDAATNQPGAPVSRAVAGSAVEDKPDAKRYAALNLQPTEAKTLFFVPDVEGEIPELDARCVWGSEPWTVRAATSIAPAGTSIGVSVVIAR